MAKERAEAARTVVAAFEGEYRRYKRTAEGALEQLADDELRARPGDGNSVAILVQHLGGNLASRFTDFLTTDGEKPWRDREAELADVPRTRDELLGIWELGWGRLFASLAALSDAELRLSVSIRGVPLTVAEALARSLAHTAYHVGQIVLLARSLRGGAWRWLGIPPGESAAYARDPRLEKPPS